MNKIFKRFLLNILVLKRLLHSKLILTTIGKYASGLLAETQQGDFIVGTEDFAVGRELLTQGTYGEDEIARVKHLTTKDSNVLFVGPHIGAIAVPISRFVKSISDVEANPITFKLLNTNIALNKCKNISTYQFAANDSNNEIEFVLGRVHSSGSKRMPVVKKYIYFFDNPTIIKVKARKLDDIFDPIFDLIFMDIEGSEYFALKGMNKILHNAKNLIVEFLPHHLDYVSNVSVEDFISVIEPYFHTLYIPTKNITVEKSEFLTILRQMYEKDEYDEGIVFSKD